MWISGYIGRIPAIAVLAILQVFTTSPVWGNCPSSAAELHLNKSDDYLSKRINGKVTCTWNLPERPILSHFLMLDFKRVELGFGRLSTLDFNVGGNQSPFCIIYVSSSLLCNIIWMRDRFSTSYATCSWKEVDVLPKNITYSNAVGIYEDLFSIHYSFVNCKKNGVQDPETTMTAKTFEPSTSNALVDSSRQPMSQSPSQSSNIAAIIVAILLGIALIASLLVVLILNRKLRAAKQNHVRSLVRFSRHQKSDQKVTQPGVSTADQEEVSGYATVEQLQEPTRRFGADAGEVPEVSLHGQNVSDEQSQHHPVPVDQCVYASVNKPKQDI